MKTTAVVLAAGQGRRFGGDIKKQFCLLNGRPLLVHSAFQFEDTDEVDDIICVVPEADLAAVKRLFSVSPPKKLKKILPGGRRRQDSVALALSYLSELSQDHDIVAIHDGVRPLITPAFISRLIHKTKQHGSAVAARPVTDSLKWCSKGKITKSLPRDNIWAMQTPQVFRFSTLNEAYRKAETEHVEATDDAAVVSLLGYEITCIEGPPDNIKVTHPSDLVLAEFLWQQQNHNKGGYSS